MVTDVQCFNWKNSSFAWTKWISAHLVVVTRRTWWFYTCAYILCFRKDFFRRVGHYPWSPSTFTWFPTVGTPTSGEVAYYPIYPALYENAQFAQESGNWVRRRTGGDWQGSRRLTQRVANLPWCRLWRWSHVVHQNTSTTQSRVFWKY